jgi:hypothetical protein
MMATNMVGTEGQDTSKDSPRDSSVFLMVRFLDSVADAAHRRNLDKDPLWLAG